jgi:hypothetical protein
MKVAAGVGNKNAPSPVDGKIQFRIPDDGRSPNT